MIAKPTLSCLIEIQIRPARLADAAVIAEFNQRLAQETEHLRLDPACIGPGVAKLLQDPAKGVYYVAETGGAVVGQVMITYEWSDWRNGNLWWLQSVYVKPEFRRRGIFRALFQRLSELACAQKDVCGLRLYMHSENHAARLCYRQLGMQRTKYEVLELDLAVRQGSS